MKTQPTFRFFFFDRFTKTSSIGIAVKCQCQEPRQRQPNRLVGSKRTTWPSFSWASFWYSSYVTLLGTSSASSRWSSSKRPWNAKPWTCTHFPYGRCIPHLLGKNNLTVKKNYVFLVVKELLFCVIGDYTYYGYLFVFNTFEIVFAPFFDLVIVCNTKEDGWQPLFQTNIFQSADLVSRYYLTNWVRGIQASKCFSRFSKIELPFWQ